MTYSKIVAFSLSLLFIQSCSEDERIIKLYDDVKLNSSYTAIVNEKTSIKPKIEGFPSANYTWINLNDNQIISTDKVLVYTFTDVGNYNLILQVESEITKEIKTAKTIVIVK